MEIVINEIVGVFAGLLDNPALPMASNWLIIGMIILFVELIHRAWLIIWFALGAIAAAITATFLPSNLFVQIGVFAGASISSLAIFVYYHQIQEKARQPVSVLPLGRKVRCIEKINIKGYGWITLDGVSYKARIENNGSLINSDDWVKITGFDSDEITAIVEPID